MQKSGVAWNGSSLVRWARTYLLAVGFLAAMPAARAAAEDPTTSPWHFSLYGGRWLDDRLIDILRFRASADNFRPSYLLGLGVGREIYRFAEPLRLELEGQFVQHFGRQWHPELNAAAVVRWTLFPWDRFVDTSIAVGEGLSYATSRPRIENRGEASRLLNYLMFEIELKPLEDSPWRVVGRIHHRSGVFGFFGGVRGGSNFILLGIRYQR